MTDNEIELLANMFFIFFILVGFIVIVGSIRNSIILHKQTKDLQKCLNDQQEMIDYLLNKKPQPQKSGWLNYSDDVFEIDEKPQPSKK